MSNTQRIAEIRAELARLEAEDSETETVAEAVADVAASVAEAVAENTTVVVEQPTGDELMDSAIAQTIVIEAEAAAAVRVINAEAAAEERRLAAAAAAETQVIDTLPSDAFVTAEVEVEVEDVAPAPILADNPPSSVHRFWR